jgi:hypothetical protein
VLLLARAVSASNARCRHSNSLSHLGPCPTFVITQSQDLSGVDVSSGWMYCRPQLDAGLKQLSPYG